MKFHIATKRLQSRTNLHQRALVCKCIVVILFPMLFPHPDLKSHNMPERVSYEAAHHSACDRDRKVQVFAYPSFARFPPSGKRLTFMLTVTGGLIVFVKSGRSITRRPLPYLMLKDGILDSWLSLRLRVPEPSSNRLAVHQILGAL